MDDQLIYMVLRVAAAIWFLICYKIILDRFYHLFDHRALKYDLNKTANAFKALIYRRQGNTPEAAEPVKVPTDFDNLARKINISRQSRKYLLGWLAEEGAPRFLKEKASRAASRDGRVNTAELKDILRELYHYKSQPDEEAYHGTRRT